MQDLSRHVGAEVTIEGRASDLYQAHLFRSPAGKRADYVDLDGGAGQVVVYVAGEERLPRGTRLRLTGVVFEVHGGDDPRSKGAGFHEHQLDVSRWERLA